MPWYTYFYEMIICRILTSVWSMSIKGRSHIQTTWFGSQSRFQFPPAHPHIMGKLFWYMLLWWRVRAVIFRNHRKTDGIQRNCYLKQKILKRKSQKLLFLSLATWAMHPCPKSVEWVCFSDIWYCQCFSLKRGVFPFVSHFRDIYYIRKMLEAYIQNTILGSLSAP